MTEPPILIDKLKENLESAAFLVSKGDSEKAAHSTIVQCLVLLAQIEALFKSSEGYAHVEPPQSASNQSIQTKKSREDEIAQELSKVRRRVPKWFRNPSQNNTKILLCFLDLSENASNVTTPMLRAECHDIYDFDGNYNQMKNFGEKNHGKVFDEVGSAVKLWEPASDFILEQYESFKKIGSQLAALSSPQEPFVYIDRTMNRLILLVDNINRENSGMSLQFHQQRVSKKNMCVKGCNGSLWIEPYADWYDIGLSGQSLTREMEGFMEATFGKKHGNKQSKPEPSHHPYWRVTDFESVKKAVYRYAGVKIA